DDGTVTVAVLTYGGILQQIVVPDRDGVRADVALGFDDLAGYAGGHPYFGALVGRFAGRIAAGHLPLNGRVYELARNHRGQHLHGGEEGFDRRVWRAQALDGHGVRLSLTSPDGDQGYPARLDVTVDYTLAARLRTPTCTATHPEDE